jgi:hypothetical protein
MTFLSTRATKASKAIRIAFLASLALHGLILCLNIGAPGTAAKNSSGAVSRLDVALKKPRAASPLPPQKITPNTSNAVSATQHKKHATPQILTAQPGIVTEHSWSVSERSQMDQFLNSLGPQSQSAQNQNTPTLAQRALAQARELGRNLQREEGLDSVQAEQQMTRGNASDRFSFDLYFDAFVRKLNRTAVSVKEQEPKTGGFRKALVRIALNPNGTMKAYQILRAADQKEQIAHIKRILDAAAPFAPFPADIRTASNSLSILMCITPGNGNDASGFSRSSSAQDCHD